MVLLTSIYFGGYICEEFKLVITLKLLASGNAFDIVVIFIVDSNVGKMDMEAHLSDPCAFTSVREGFSKCSNGVLKGAIGTIDGLLVDIVGPYIIKDKNKNIISS